MRFLKIMAQIVLWFFSPLSWVADRETVQLGLSEMFDAKKLEVSAFLNTTQLVLSINMLFVVFSEYSDYTFLILLFAHILSYVILSVTS